MPSPSPGRVFSPARFWLAILLFAPTPTILWGAEVSVRRAAVEALSLERFRKHVDVLADDTFEGREAGSRGGRAAGIYLVNLLKEYGLHGRGDDGGFYQRFGAGYANVLAVLEGRDPVLKNEFVIVSAHYDHVGLGTRGNSNGPIGKIHNGADDNASGVSGLMAVCEAFSRRGQPPRRSILFCFWDAEEKGLLGSKHWLEHPTAPLEKVKLMINGDMIGRLRDNRLEVYGARTAPGLRQLLSRHNDADLLVMFSWELKENSDHYPFFARRIPVLMFHTGLHDDYHRPSDDADRVNVPGIQKVVRLLANLADAAAETDELPAFRPASTMETVASQQVVERTAPPLSGRLGITWEESEQGPIVRQVTGGSAAEKAGVSPGDRIVRLGDREIGDGESLMAQVWASPSETTLLVARSEGQEPIRLPLVLDGKPVRLGISWREDDAEPRCVIVNRVTAGTAAARAGIRVNDRVHALNDRTFASGEEFAEQVRAAKSPLRLAVERDGQVLALEAIVEELKPEASQAIAASDQGESPAKQESNAVARP